MRLNILHNREYRYDTRIWGGHAVTISTRLVL